ncbi:MAG TPA: ATP-binding protein, partial [Opitutus sp.]|nr:ATP-binding protein [Opitutus sp.]
IKFTPSRGEVQVTTMVKNDTVVLRVRDTGTGINPEFLPHVFERFRQADASTTRQYGGLGLGLSIVKQLVELHGGEIRAESAGIGRGATFTVSIPRLESSDAAETSSSPALHQTAPSPSPAELRGVRVLVVEDETDSAQLMKRVLESHQADVRLAQSMPSALTEFAQFKPHLVLSDIGMPHHDGYELIRRLRALPEARRLPAIAITALARREDIDRALQAGFDLHLAKPLRPAELLRAVLTLVGRNVTDA